MIWELRHYAIAPGRIADIHARFRDHLPALLARHRIKVVGRWTANGNTERASFIYVMAYRDLAQREAQWRDFYADPAWPDIRARSNGASDIVRAIDITFLRPLIGWQPKAPDITIGGIHELVLTRVANGQSAAVGEELRIVEQMLERRGGKVLLIADLVTGSGLPKCAMLVAWEDEEHRRSSQYAIALDPGRLSAVAGQIKVFGQSLLGDSEVLLLDPAAEALPRGQLGFEHTQSI
jgi:hypothetical protein